MPRSLANNNLLRPIAIFLFGILILAVLIEEYRNSSSRISSCSLFSSDFGVTVQKVFYNVTRDPSETRQRKVYIVHVDSLIYRKISCTGNGQCGIPILLPVVGGSRIRVVSHGTCVSFVRKRMWIPQHFIFSTTSIVY